MFKTWVCILCLLAYTAPACGEPHARGGGKATAKHSTVHPGQSQGDDDADEDTHLDGSKLFTNDTEPNEIGNWSASLGYFLATARRFFGDTGEQTRLGGTRRSQLLVGSVAAGFADNWDLTLQASGERLNDLFPAPGMAAGSGFTNASVIARWRFYNDEETSRSAAVCFGPAFVGQLFPQDNHTYLEGGSFVGWQQSLVFRQDFDKFSADLELDYSFPLQSTLNTFQQLGANLGVGYQANSWLLPVVELNYVKVLPSSGAPSESLGATLGFIFKPNDKMAISVGVQKTLTGRNIENFTTYVLAGSAQF